MDFTKLLVRLRNDPEWIVLGLLVLFLGVGGGGYYYRSTQQDLADSKRHFVAVYRAYGRAETAEDYEEVVGQFQRLLNRYSGTEVETKIRFYLGKSLLKAGKTREAARQFNALTGSANDDFFVPAARLQGAVAQLRLENYEYALQKLNKLEQGLEAGHPLKIEAAWQKARLYESLGDTEARRDTLKKIVDQAGEEMNYWQNRAREELAEIAG